MLKNEVIKKIIENRVGHRFLLYGPPGTGKSSWPFYFLKERPIFKITLHSHQSPDELIGFWKPSENGFIFHEGPVVKAFRQGGVLILDEIDRASGAVETILHEVLDDISIAQIYLDNGKVIKPREGFVVWATTNLDSPDEIDFALFDRFDFVIPVYTLTTEIEKTFGSEITQKIAREIYGEVEKIPKIPLTRRKLIVLDKVINQGYNFSQEELKIILPWIVGQEANHILVSLSKL